MREVKQAKRDLESLDVGWGRYGVAHRAQHARSLCFFTCVLAIFECESVLVRVL